jgi:hypothetical protein
MTDPTSLPAPMKPNAYGFMICHPERRKASHTSRLIFFSGFVLEGQALRPLELYGVWGSPEALGFTETPCNFQRYLSAREFARY